MKSSFLCSECKDWDENKKAICTAHKLFPKDNGCIFHLEWYFDSNKMNFKNKSWIFRTDQRLDLQK